MDPIRRIFLVILLAMPLLPLAPATSAGGGAVQLDVVGAIGPATADYFRRGLEKAVDSGAELVILRMDTPGGLSSSMRDIIQDILASPIPIVGFVAPRGARAASAGTYMLYATHIAAMAPATNLGAATPVRIGPGGGTSPAPDGEGEPKDEGKPPAGDTMTRKTVNDAVAYIRGLARLRGRNADWAEKAVRGAASLDAQAALEENVIDLVAPDVPALLKAIDGRIVKIGGGELTLATAGMAVRVVQPDWRTKLLSVITDPNVAYILLLIGIYGLIFEFSNPGMVVPGVIGAICLLLALFAFQVLPISYAGAGLMLLGVALMIGEAFAPSFGILGIGGAAAFVIGSVMLIDTDAPGFGISPALIGAFALSSILLFAVVLGVVWRARHRPVVSGSEEMVGASAVALEDFDEKGSVRTHGERWRAQTEVPIRKGQRLRVVAIHGLTLEVTPKNGNQGSQP